MQMLRQKCKNTVSAYFADSANCEVGGYCCRRCAGAEKDGQPPFHSLGCRRVSAAPAAAPAVAPAAPAVATALAVPAVAPAGTSSSSCSNSTSRASLGPLLCAPQLQIRPVLLKMRVPSSDFLMRRWCRQSRQFCAVQPPPVTPL